jgi:hypothetical protein
MHSEGAAMASGEVISLELPYWSEFVGTFDPWKVARRVKATFPGAVIDPTDYQEVRLNRELEFWARSDIPEATRQALIGQSKRCYRDNGPTYRFEIPCGLSAPIKGCARRYRVWFELPAGAPEELRQRILAFLETLALGPTKLQVRTKDVAREPADQSGLSRPRPPEPPA